MCLSIFSRWKRVGNFKKKTRKHAIDQESEQEKKEKMKENTLSTKKVTKKREKQTLFFSRSVSWSSYCFLLKIPTSVGKKKFDGTICPKGRADQQLVNEADGR